jgi:hypothetical protein
LLLKSLALQIGQPVSVNELSNHLKVSAITIERYLDLLEKTFVIFSLSPFSSNLRNEMKKNRKFYFYDIGIRNALLGNFIELEYREDIGSIWENFCIADRIKSSITKKENAQFYYWQTYDGAEIDLVEESNGRLNTFEFKWNPRKKAKIPKSFEEKYPVEAYKVINRENLNELIKP